MQYAEFPELSVAEYVFVVCPIGKSPPFVPSPSYIMVTSPELSDTVGSDHEICAVATSESVETDKEVGQLLKTGSSLSENEIIGYKHVLNR